MSEEINTDHFSTMEELLEHLKNWERDDDTDAYYRFFCPSCAFELANKIEKQQKEIEGYKIIRNMLEETQMKLFETRKDVEKYQRYFKLAISDLQSEGFMQMPYENIKEYYSKREDIV